MEEFFTILRGSYSKKPPELVFKEDKVHEKGFADHYNEHLKPLAEDYEINRIEALKKVKKKIILFLPLFIIFNLFWVYLFYPFFIVPGNESLINIIFLYIIWFGLWFISNGWIYSKTRTAADSYDAEVKKRIFPKIVSFVDGFSYSPTCNISVRETYAQSKLFKTTDFKKKENNSDEFNGIYKGVKIKFFNVELTRKVLRTDYKNRYEDEYCGIIIEIESKKKFNGQIVIKQDGGKLLNASEKRELKKSKLQNIKLEDPKFEEIFEVYGSDQIEARYLLTTSFMERLIELEGEFYGTEMECAFYDNRLLIMIETGHVMFESDSITKPENFVETSKSILAEMYSINKIIDTLKLDQDIGM